MPPIKSGIFIMPFHDPAKPLAQCYDEDMELVIRADELGIEEFWIGEHHTMAYENMPMPELFIAAAMRETSNIHMGPAPICLQQHHPVLVASRLAMLDHLCKGRLDLCFGPGSVSTDMEILGIEPKNSSAMVAESMEMILKLWSSDGPIDLEGTFWDIKMDKTIDLEIGLGIVHKPYQKPHPPISMPITSWNSGTAKMAGRMGFQPFAHSVIASNVVGNIWDTYETVAVEAGHIPDRSDFKITRAIFLADTTEEAQRAARTNSLAGGFHYIGDLLDKGGRGRGMMKRDQAMSDADCNFDYWMEEQIIAGDVDHVLKRLLGMIEETGEFGTLVMMAYDWDDKERWLHCIDLFANELMPALNKAVGGGAG
jgi:alkanesulfonate monooxygenase SsuD/methylene tetrahydromethanopterin reductase-like flavin-dependent oxidoreductase (luciferase family)